MKVKSESEVAQSSSTLSDPMDCSPPGSSIHGIFQARVLEWGAIAFSKLETDILKYISIILGMGKLFVLLWLGLPCGSVGKESTCNAGDLGSIPGLGRSPGEGKGYPLQYSGLKNSMDYRPWSSKESDMKE